MPLRIRCPHCRYVLVVADEAAGEVGFCDYCKRGFTIPLPIRDTPERAATVAAGKSCPHCKHGVAPGAKTCPRCDTNLADGTRPSWWRRVRWNSPRTWVVIGGIVVGMIAISVTTNHIYRVYYLPSKNPIAPFEPSQRTAQSGKTDVDSLFSAKILANRIDAAARLRQLGADAGAALAEGLNQSLEQGSPSENTIRNQRVAVRALGEVGSPAVFETLERAQRVPALRDDAVISRAMLGDSRVTPDAATVWLAQLQRVLFSARIDSLQFAQRDAARTDWAIAEWETFQRYSDALRKLGPAAIQTIADSYWDSWVWLGQSRAEGFSSAIFELAKPERSDAAISTASAQDENREDVRAARRTLDEIALRAAPATRAAVILTLAQCTPQYKRLRERHIAALAELIGECPAADQQRLAWSLAKLTGRQFATLTETAFPADAGPEAISAVVDWARSANTTTAPAPFKHQSTYAVPPSLTRRVVSSAQQQRAALSKQFHASFAQTYQAATAWIEADLGCPPAITTMLAPGPQQPDYPALTAAMLIAANYGESSAIPHLQVWSIATDQPMWLRAMAGLARASFDARGGLPIELPNDIQLDSLPADGPDWPIFGAIIAAGGERMIARIASITGISNDTRAQLLDSARREAARRDQIRSGSKGGRLHP